jgi:hypothetical protein
MLEGEESKTPPKHHKLQPVEVPLSGGGHATAVPFLDLSFGACSAVRPIDVDDSCIFLLRPQSEGEVNYGCHSPAVCHGITLQADGKVNRKLRRQLMNSGSDLVCWHPQVATVVSSFMMIKPGSHVHHVCASDSVCPHKMVLHVPGVSHLFETHVSLPLMTPDHLATPLSWWQPLPPLSLSPVHTESLSEFFRLAFQPMCKDFHGHMGRHPSQGALQAADFYNVLLVSLHFLTDPTVLYTRLYQVGVVGTLLHLMRNLELHDVVIPDHLSNSRGNCRSSCLAVQTLRPLAKFLTRGQWHHTPIGVLNLINYVMMRTGWSLSLLDNPVRNMFEHEVFVEQLGKILRTGTRNTDLARALARALAQVNQLSETDTWMLDELILVSLGLVYDRHFKQDLCTHYVKMCSGTVKQRMLYMENCVIGFALSIFHAQSVARVRRP